MFLMDGIVKKLRDDDPEEGRSNKDEQITHNFDSIEDALRKDSLMFPNTAKKVDDNYFMIKKDSSRQNQEIKGATEEEIKLNLGDGDLTPANQTINNRKK